MINSIEITINNGFNENIHLIIFYSKRICFINNKTYSLIESFIDEIIKIIRLWNNEYGNDKKIDSEEFKVVVTTNERQEIFHGKGIFPENYYYFKKLLGDIHD